MERYKKIFMKYYFKKLLCKIDFMLILRSGRCRRSLMISIFPFLIATCNTVL